MKMLNIFNHQSSFHDYAVSTLLHTEVSRNRGLYRLIDTSKQDRSLRFVPNDVYVKQSFIRPLLMTAVNNED